MTDWTGEAALGTPYWWEAAAPQDPGQDLPGVCDFLVIGAGYCGLTAAIAAHDCGAKVVVVDAGVPGEGASSRNGGMVGAHPRLGWDDLATKFGPTVANDIFAEAKPALDWVTSLIADEAIDCDFQQTGRLQLAWTPSHAAAQKRLAGYVRDKSEVRAELLDRDALRSEIATECYHGGLLFPEHGALHPAKYHAGLMKAALRRGISVVSHAGVSGYEREGAGFVVETAKGRITAEKLMLATNGYTRKPFKWHVARVFPLPSYIIATDELPSNLLRHLAPGRRMMVETRARHSYFRLSPDGKRVLFGGRASMRDLPLDRAADRMRDTMCEVWPELRDVQLSHAWKGYTGYSFTHMPHVGEDRGLHYAMGFSGSGTVMAPYLGAKAAWRAMGDARGQTAYADTHLTRHVLHPFEAPHFLKAADIYYRNWVDRMENRAARRG